jgi:hypothetical protein
MVFAGEIASPARRTGAPRNGRMTGTPAPHETLID